MIVPQDRLLFWFGIVVLPFAAIGLIIPSAAIPSIIVIGGLFILVLVDALLTRRSLKGITMEFPQIIHMSKNHEGKIDVYIRNSEVRTRQLRIALAFPKEVVSTGEDIFLKLQGGDRVSHFHWRCKPIKRGSYFFDKCYMEGLSYFGFWAVRSALPASFEIRVYPDLSFERKNLAALFLNRGNFGIHSRRQVGQGRDFEKLREYIHGDSYDHIHWKTTAKRGYPITKVFQIEQTQEVYVIIDASRLSGRSVNIFQEDKNETILEKFITAALIIGVAARRQGDLFGILSFSNRIHSFIRAKRGREHYNNCRESLYKLQPHIVTPDLDELCAFIGLRLRRRALLVFLTNIDDPVLAESFVKNMDLICRKHLVLVNMIKPDGMKPLFSDSDIKSINDIYQNLGGHILWHNILELEKILQRKGVSFSLLNNEKMCSHLISQYMDVKQRQLI
ncbi:MAG: hypothetical protein A3H23_02390 [Planctomycetes bacterium RIFCSPLOWO2_12_FULL_40_19]|nr:MAG: hypothetical protein A3H23_02390 [Planctomycetes bacterium RIFCSPLOWO2_12_FULL_40_19]